jgi:hypothetical protein
VEFLMKSEKGTPMKEWSAEFKVGTTTVYGLEWQIWLMSHASLTRDSTPVPIQQAKHPRKL